VSATPIETDALIIGAGPVGLFQAFELGLLEQSFEIVDALPQPGGQCAQLYPDKPIYDVPGLPVISGQQLVEQLLLQIAPFKPRFHQGQLVSQLQRQGDGRWLVATDQGARFIARTVIIAAGAGAFLPRSLPMEGIEQFLGGQVLHQLPRNDSLMGEQLLILGDEDEALAAAMALAQQGQCKRITLMHRRDQFRASAELVAQLAALRAQGAVQFIAGHPLRLISNPENTRLTGLEVLDSNGQTVQLPCDRLLILMGLSPRLGPLADWGLALVRRQLPVTTEAFETAEPGLYAVGDINTYPGKRKLLLCGFHEATLAAFGVAQRLAGGKSPLLQYTTTSPRLQQLLGVSGAGHKGP
jgi:thioredoxin reductase (NADPH)